ncbi:MAG: 2-C-methyl-D-erythritol 4-phosphate cytidylyltransferase [Thermomicrobiales bacterium]
MNNANRRSLDSSGPNAEPRTPAAAVIVAAGRGERFGAADKVFLPLAGRPILAYALDAVEAAASIAAVVIVVGEHTRATAVELVAAGPWTKVTAIVAGGERRQDSVAAGLAAVPDEVEIVAIHDGARPFAPAALFDACVAAATATGAAIAAVPVTDTIKRVVNGQIAATVPRADLWAAQTPQAFVLARLREAFEYTALHDLTVTDEAALFELLGWPVRIVPGAPSNLKITHREDLVVAEAIPRDHGLGARS